MFVLHRHEQRCLRLDVRHVHVGATLEQNLNALHVSRCNECVGQHKGPRLWRFQGWVDSGWPTSLCGENFERGRARPRPLDQKRFVPIVTLQSTEVATFAIAVDLLMPVDLLRELPLSSQTHAHEHEPAHLWRRDAEACSPGSSLRSDWRASLDLAANSSNNR